MILVVILSLAVAVGLIYLMYSLARNFQQAAADKGYVGRRYFPYCFWLGLPGMLLVIALPNKNAGNSAAVNNSWQLPSL